MKFNTQYHHLNDPIASESKPSLTDQQYKDSCDISFIVSQYAKLGIPIPQSPVSYADLTSVEDYQNALLTVSQYKSAFESLPSADRERFHGDVSEYLAFIANSNNLKESLEKNYIDPSSVSEEVLNTLFNQTNDFNQTVKENVVETQPEPSGEESV